MIPTEKLRQLAEGGEKTRAKYIVGKVEREPCRIVNEKGTEFMVCKMENFFRAMGIENQHPDKIDWYENLYEIPDEGADELVEEWRKKHIDNLDGCVRRFLTSWPIEGVLDVNLNFEKDEVRVELADKNKFLNSIREAMNGVGMFYAPSNKEFIEQAGGTADKVIISHFGWLKDAPEVWGTQSLSRCLERD